MARRFVTRKRDGTFRVRVGGDLADVLGILVDQLDPQLDDPSKDPTLRRLFPPAHPDDLVAEAAWEIERGDELRDARRATLDVVRSVGDGPLDEERLVAWVQGVNALRLVLAERLSVSGDEDAEREAILRAQALVEDEDAPRAEREEAYRTLGQWQVYELLGALVHDAVAALDD